MHTEMPDYRGAQLHQQDPGWPAPESHNSQPGSGLGFGHFGDDSRPNLAPRSESAHPNLDFDPVRGGHVPRPGPGDHGPGVGFDRNGAGPELDPVGPAHGFERVHPGPPSTTLSGRVQGGLVQPSETPQPPQSQLPNQTSIVSKHRNDMLYGGNGNDTLISLEGNNYLSGGDGATKTTTRGRDRASRTRRPSQSTEHSIIV